MTAGGGADGVPADRGTQSTGTTVDGSTVKGSTVNGSTDRSGKGSAPLLRARYAGRRARYAGRLTGFDRRRTAALAAATSPGDNVRSGSLRREWSWAFLLMFIVVLLGAGATVIGVRGVMDEVRGATSRLHTESGIVAGLRTAFGAHEQAGLRLLAGEPSFMPSYVQGQQELSDLFINASAVLPAEQSMRAEVVEARRLWQENLASHGLRADQVQVTVASRLAEVPAFIAAGERIRARLDAIERSSLISLDTAIASSTRLEHLVIAVRTAVFCLGAVAVVLFRRRVVKYLMQPLAGLNQGVAKLRSGNYRHRIKVVRNDELGELAQAFNSLAAAVDDSYQELTHRATHDSLTGLANRAALVERLAAAFGPGGDRMARHTGLLFIDIDDFKDVNDSLGHDTGDSLLIQLAARLRSCVRPDDLVARLGGDEFAIVIMNGEDSSGTGAVAERIRLALRAPFELGGSCLAATISMGGSQRRPDTADPSALLREADFAMYMAKHGGKDRYELFDADSYGQLAAKAKLKRAPAAARAEQFRGESQASSPRAAGTVRR